MKGLSMALGITQPHADQSHREMSM